MLKDGVVLTDLLLIQWASSINPKEKRLELAFCGMITLVDDSLIDDMVG